MESSQTYNDLSVQYFINTLRKEPRKSLYNPFIRLFLLLMAVNTVFIVIHVIVSVAGDNVANGLFHINRDRSIPEFFQYFQLALITLFLGLVAWKRHSRLYLSWVLIFTYILFDDALQLHEHVGRIIGIWLDLSKVSGLDPEDLGELSMMMIVGLVLLGILVWNFVRSTDHEDKLASRILGIGLIALVICGMGIDLIHSQFEQSRWPNAILAILEDGGEQVVASAILCVALYLADRELTAGSQELANGSRGA